MHTLEDIVAIVLEFAQNNPHTSSPLTIDDPIVPKPAEMPSIAYQNFFEALSTHLNASQINCNLPFDGIHVCETWIGISVTVFFNQV